MVSPGQMRKRRPFSSLVSTLELAAARATHPFTHREKDASESESDSDRDTTLEDSDCDLEKENYPMDKYPLDCYANKKLTERSYEENLYSQRHYEESEYSGNTYASHHYEDKLHDLSFVPLEDLSQGEPPTDHLRHTPIRTFQAAQELLPRIDAEEMARILSGARAGLFDEYIVVDCRFRYEYQGGHIDGAMHAPLQSELQHMFFGRPVLRRTRLLIFHCEYSVFRAPTMASHLRKLDRAHNAHRYPYLHYPDIVVLDGGYRRFFETHRSLCQPQGYVEMRDIKHRATCETQMHRVLQAAKLTRARLFHHPPRRCSLHARLASCSAFDPPSPLARKRSTKLRRADLLAPPAALFHRALLLLALLALLLLLLCSEPSSFAFLSSDLLIESVATPTGDTDLFDGKSDLERSFTFPSRPRLALGGLSAFSSPPVSSPLTGAPDDISDAPLELRDVRTRDRRAYSSLGALPFATFVDEVDEEGD